MSDDARVIGINESIVSIEFGSKIILNEVAYIETDGLSLKSEVIKISDKIAQLQVFESTKGVRVGDMVKLTNELLSVDLGPGMLGMLYDGLQNPLDDLAEQDGEFIKKGSYIPALNQSKLWAFRPEVNCGALVTGGDIIGVVLEKTFSHKIMVPLYIKEKCRVVSIVSDGEYNVSHQLALIEDESKKQIPVKMSFRWPVKKAINNYKERLLPTETLITKVRVIDTFFPVALGGTYCIPGPFGAGKTILQQITSRHATVDIVIIAACGERASEIVETIEEFPKLIDPKNGRPLMERTIIVCNTSSMPVAARESSVYTAVTMAEYYRQMGLNVLLLADSTSRWAQAIRERSGRLEEIPGDEAFPAYLESVIAAFYERAGVVRLNNGAIGSVTIGGTVSPAGGNFEEPVTQATLKVVGAFHALSQERADSRRYPSIDPLESWSHYSGIISQEQREDILALLFHANDINQMMMVVGEEGVSITDYTTYLKSELIDSVYLQQNAFDEIDVASDYDRQQYTFAMIWEIVRRPFIFSRRDEVRHFFHKLRQLILDFNGIGWGEEELDKKKNEIDILVDGVTDIEKSKIDDSKRQVFIESELESSFRKNEKLSTGRSILVENDIEKGKDNGN